MPAAAYVCSGSRAVDVWPSPKSQAQPVGVPVEVSVKWTASGAGPEVGSGVKAAVNAGTAVKIWTRLGLPWVR